MKSRIIAILLFVSITGIAQVPDTETFSLDTVRKVLGLPANSDLGTCFSTAVKGNFDPIYDSIGYAPVGSLKRFRNYQEVNGGTIKCGYIYNWYCVRGDSIANSGWRVPSDSDWITLRDYLANNGYGYEGSGNDIAKSIASVNGWEISTINGAPGKDTLANNSSGFNSYPSGTKSWGGGWSGIKWTAYYWSATARNSSEANLWYFSYNGTTLLTSYYNYFIGYSLKLIKNTTSLSHGQTGTYVGNDGRIYNTICIGTQEWMSENLAETQFRFGTNIPTVTGSWNARVVPTKGAYADNESNVFK